MRHVTTFYLLLPFHIISRGGRQDRIAGRLQVLARHVFRVSPLASVVLLGWAIATSQTMLLRETLAAAQGNELAIALALGQWLVLTAAGSAAAGLLPSRFSRRFLVVGALLLGPALFAALLTARGCRHLFAGAGRAAHPGRACAGLLLTLAPVCLVGGVSFTLACRLPGVAPAARLPGRGSGSAPGGVTATWLVETWQPFAVAGGWPSGGAGAALLAGRAWIWAPAGVALLPSWAAGSGAIEASSRPGAGPGKPSSRAHTPATAMRPCSSAPISAP